MKDKIIEITDREIIDEQIQNFREEMDKVKKTGFANKEEKMINISREIRELINTKKNLI